MKECFGLSFGFLWEDRVQSEDEREKCYRCDDFERCFKIALVRSLKALRLEMHKGVRGIRNSLGGSHSEHPFG